MDLSNIIKKYREEYDLTMQQFADKSGLSKAYISMLERGYQPRNKGKIIPTIKTISKVAGAMNMSPDELVAMLDDNQRICIVEPLPDPAGTQQLTKPEEALLADFRQLNAEGQEKVQDYTSDLVASGRYKKDNLSGMEKEA